MTAARAKSTAKAKPAESLPADAPPLPTGAFDASALLASATIVERKESNHRDSVDVPPEVIAFAQNLYDTSKAAKFPVTDAKVFAEQKLMWQSAGDKTTPLTSATVVEIREPAKDDDGKPLYQQATDSDGEPLWLNAECTEPRPDTDNPVMNLTGLRVSFGKRRGQNKPATTPAPSPSTAPESGQTDD